MTEATSQGYAPGTHPDLPPPMLASGPLYWLKKNLFSSWYNITLTVLGVWFLWATIPPMFHWAIGGAVFEADSRAACQQLGDGACWAFIQERFTIFVYGFYPVEARWRVDLAF